LKQLEAEYFNEKVQVRSDRAEEARFKAVDIAYDRCSATGDIVKYICKNIDGEFQEKRRGC
jgi:hypothetical protein